MTEKPVPKPDDPEQFARFKKAAKEAGLDETGEGSTLNHERLFPKTAAAEDGRLVNLRKY